jgi:hypothetical protein
VHIPNDNILALRQSDQPRADFAIVEDHLDFIAGQLARVPTRAYLCRMLLLTSTKAPAAAPSRERRRTRVAKPAGGKHSSLTLNDQVLALATGKTQQEIAAACQGARPNHVGAALARHKRAGRIEEREGKLYAMQSTETTQRAAS